MSNSSSSPRPQASFLFSCYFSKPTSYIFTSYVVTLVLLLLPVCLYVVRQGLRHWTKPSPSSSSSSSSAAAVTMSHSDVFACHAASFQVVGVLGNLPCLCAIYLQDQALYLVGHHAVSFTWFGEIYFHMLTCVERHVAAVHPVAYMRLRGERGARLRNAAAGAVWLLSLAGISVLMTEAFVTLDLVFVFSGLAVVSFCSASVLCALVGGPGAGRRGAARARVEPSKRRALYTVVTITVVLLLKFSWNAAWAIKHLAGTRMSCDTLGLEIWFNLPSSLVLPLLFLHRRGKRAFWQPEGRRH